MSSHASFLQSQGMAAGWRWVQGWLGIFSGVLTIISFFFGECYQRSGDTEIKKLNRYCPVMVPFRAVPETYSPTLLRNRAAQLSKVTGKHYRASMDAKKPLHIPSLFKVSLSRPWQLLFLEPIVVSRGARLCFRPNVLDRFSNVWLGPQPPCRNYTAPHQYLHGYRE